VRLGYDESLFTGPAASPHWEPDYLPDNVVSPISALWVDEGRERTGFSARSTDPAAAAADVFAAELRERRIVVVGSPVAAVAPPTARQVAAVESGPLAQVAEHVLEVSDNEASEVLARHVALSRGAEPSFTGGAAAVSEVLAELGVDLAGTVIHDGSGLARSNRLRDATLVDVLEVAAADPDLRAVHTGLPVAGFSGSLAFRFETADPAGLGEVRAKTGTLTGVSGLAGTVVTRDGLVLGFVAIADRIRPRNTLDARARLDEIAAALAACTCAA
jgi:D-alanyl-D-alanine carboxypeptidase/D-alanyl-D-alanine-endopeptidase (penicillin-binding protein 4)